MSTEKIYSGDEIVASGALPDWVTILDSLQARFRTGNFATGLKLVDAIGEAAESANHHPDLDLRYPHLNVRLTSHDAGAITQRDVDLATQISRLAAQLGVDAAPEAVARVEIALDTPDMAQVRPFWEAVLGLSGDHPDGEIRDGGGDLPTLWFQRSEGGDLPRQRFHLDIWVAPQVAEQRVKDALAAGGVLVSDAHGPSFTVLADAQGNKACVCTHRARSQ